MLQILQDAWNPRCFLAEMGRHLLDTAADQVPFFAAGPAAPAPYVPMPISGLSPASSFSNGSITASALRPRFLHGDTWEGSYSSTMFRIPQSESQLVILSIGHVLSISNFFYCVYKQRSDFFNFFPSIFPLQQSAMSLSPTLPHARTTRTWTSRASPLSVE